MKKLLFIIMMITSTVSLAQIKSANLTASGLTCSMCSKAIYKALVELPTIQDIKVDIKNSTYFITFKERVPVSLEAIRTAVEDAGFSVASLKVTANFEKIEAAPGVRVSLQGSTYNFVNIPKQVIEGVKMFIVVDKNYLPLSEHRKYAKYIATLPNTDKAYHITLL